MVVVLNDILFDRQCLRLKCYKIFYNINLSGFGLIGDK